MAELGAELGLFGLIAITDARTPRVDRELDLFFHDLYQDDIPSLSQDFDSFNGGCFPGNTPTFSARVGERVRWRIGALGKEFHVFHLHGHRWRIGDRYDDSMVLGPSATLTITLENYAGPTPPRVNASTENWADIIVLAEPHAPADGNALRFTITSVSAKTGTFNVTFSSPCGKRQVAVNVR